MLRFKILVSAPPLIVAAILARVEFLPGSRPCIALGSETVEIAPVPWHADLHVSFTDDPKLATVRVAISNNAEVADFAVVDDVNAAAPASLMEEVAKPDATGLALLRDAADAMRLSARGYHRVLRVARTLADLDGAGKVGRVHLAEALSYRALTDEVRRAA